MLNERVHYQGKAGFSNSILKIVFFDILASAN